MNVTVDLVEGRVPVTVLRLEGDLDAASYEALIAEGQAQYALGARDMLLDMRAVGYMGSSGLVALHTLAMVLAGGEPPDPEAGWEAHHAISRAIESGMQTHLKVLLTDDPASSIRRVMDRTGMNRFVEVLGDEPAAIASF